MPRFADLRRAPSYVVRYAIKRLRFALPATGRPAVTYGTYRTASTSIHRALQQARGGLAIKAHALAPQHLGHFMRRSRPPLLCADGVPLCVHYGNFAVRHGVILPGRPADVVMTVRDPVATVASMFYSFSAWWTDRVRRAVDRGDDDAELRSAVEEAFFGRFPRSLMLDWLSSDVPGGLGWSVLAQPFDADRGWHEYSHGHLRVLVLRTDVSSGDKERALREFLDAPGLTLPQTNSGLEYARNRTAVSAAVKRVLRGRPEWVEGILGDPRSRHLWGDAGVRRMRESWLTPKRTA